MQNQFLYPGAGEPLYRVTASTGNAKTEPWTTTIPNNGYSETIGAHDCKELMFEFIFGAAATGSVLIEKVATQNAAAAGETFDTLTVTAQTSANWNAGEPLLGFFRIKNTSGQTVVATVQKRIS